MARQARVILQGPSASGEFYWSLRAGNGRVIADGAEGYRRKAGAQRAIDAFLDLVGARDRIPVLDETVDRRRKVR